LAAGVRLFWAHCTAPAGYHGQDQSPAFLEAEAARIGYPLLVKAVLGGGGKGMKIATCAAEFQVRRSGGGAGALQGGRLMRGAPQEALASAKRESLAAFSDERVLLERLIQRPRHVEVQVRLPRSGGHLPPQSDAHSDASAHRCWQTTTTVACTCSSATALCSGATRR